MIRYLWKPKPDPDDGLAPQGAICFTYHLNSGIRALLGGFLLAALVEAVALHVLLSFVNQWLAIAATLATLYFALQVIAQMRAVGMTPLYLHDGKLTLRNGAFEIGQIPIKDIAKVELTTQQIKVSKGRIKPLNVTYPAPHNVVLRLNSLQSATIMDRQKRDFEIALLAIDDATQFKAVLDQERVVEAS